jgi:hypothetical protein
MLPDLPPCLRFHPALPYMVPAGDRNWREIWRGPAMMAAVQGRDGPGAGVHRTWIDLRQPKGKAVIVAGDTELGAKKLLGSKKGGAIRLWTPAGAEVLVMGEGIETTLTARVAGDPSWAYWAGVDLGNMAGRRETGKGLKFAGRPDLTDDDAWVPPPWVKRLIFIRDGDSEPRLTRAQLLSGLRRAMALRPGLQGFIADAGDGRDLNDLLTSAETITPSTREEEGSD